MKRILNPRSIVALLLSLILLASSAAFADAATYPTTQSFLNALDARGVTYSYKGMNENNYERVDISFRMDNYDSQTCAAFINEEEVNLRIWYIVDVSAGKNYALSVVNGLNSDYKYAKFVLDESDNTLTAEADFPVDANSGSLILEAMFNLFNLIDNDTVAATIHSLE